MYTGTPNRSTGANLEITYMEYMQTYIYSNIHQNMQVKIPTDIQIQMKGYDVHECTP